MDNEVKGALQRRVQMEIAVAIRELADASTSRAPISSLKEAQVAVNKAICSACALDPDDTELVVR